jgi:hypothetical protein
MGEGQAVRRHRGRHVTRTQAAAHSRTCRRHRHASREGAGRCRDTPPRSLGVGGGRQRRRPPRPARQQTAPQGPSTAPPPGPISAAGSLRVGVGAARQRQRQRRRAAPAGGWEGRAAAWEVGRGCCCQGGGRGCGAGCQCTAAAARRYGRGCGEDVGRGPGAGRRTGPRRGEADGGRRCGTVAGGNESEIDESDGTEHSAIRTDTSTGRHISCRGARLRCWRQQQRSDNQTVFRANQRPRATHSTE